MHIMHKLFKKYSKFTDSMCRICEKIIKNMQKICKNCAKTMPVLKNMQSVPVTSSYVRARAFNVHNYANYAPGTSRMTAGPCWYVP